MTSVDKWKKVGQSLVNSAINAGENLLDNATGGLYSSLTEGGAGSVMKAHDEYKETWQHSVMEYLAQANLLQGGEQWQNSD